MLSCNILNKCVFFQASHPYKITLSVCVRLKETQNLKLKLCVLTFAYIEMILKTFNIDDNFNSAFN